MRYHCSRWTVAVLPWSSQEPEHISWWPCPGSSSAWTPGTSRTDELSYPACPGTASGLPSRISTVQKRTPSQRRKARIARGSTRSNGTPGCIVSKLLSYTYQKLMICINFIFMACITNLYLHEIDIMQIPMKWVDIFPQIFIFPSTFDTLLSSNR